MPLKILLKNFQKRLDVPSFQSYHTHTLRERKQKNGSKKGDKNG